MRFRVAATCILATAIGWPVQAAAQAPAADSIRLAPPAKTGGLTMIEALWARASVTSWSGRELTLQDLSDLLWAANGINRPDKKRTAASAMNAQDVDIYVLTKAGAYLYDPAEHALTLVTSGDHRAEMRVPADPPVELFLVSDGARFPRGGPELKREWGALDTGIVSQNIALFCAARGLATRPRASFDAERLRAVLKLRESQHPFLNHPVGYPVEARRPERGE